LIEKVVDFSDWIRVTEADGRGGDVDARVGTRQIIRSYRTGLFDRWVGGYFWVILTGQDVLRYPLDFRLPT
jgi:hypothetical protein